MFGSHPCHLERGGGGRQEESDCLAAKGAEEGDPGATKTEGDEQESEESVYLREEPGRREGQGDLATPVEDQHLVSPSRLDLVVT